MKLAMAQMRMSGDTRDNLKKSLELCDAAKGADLLFFPEIQLTPFFPQYEKRDVGAYRVSADGDEVNAFRAKAKEHGMYICPNMYLEQGGRCYDANFWVSPKGELEDIAKMVHIAQAEQFYEQDYYTPSDDGFKVLDTPFGKVGIVICFDRHLPESIRTCTMMGADLIIIPTANCKSEPMEMFEWEIRVQAMQNQVFVAMCNRVGLEDGMDFAGESIVVAPDGSVVVKADDSEQLVVCDIDLSEAKKRRASVPYISTRRPECYK